MQYSLVINPSLTALGISIREVRGQLGLTQEQLAERCDFDRTYISLVERGQRNPSFLNLLRLAAGLGLSVSQLTKNIENPNSAK